MSKLPDPFSIKPTKEQIRTTREILDAIFKDPQIKYGLREFARLKIEESLIIFEKEKGKFYIHCIKRDKDILVYDKNKNLSKPEEIIRQLWLVKLIQNYQYPLERIDVEVNVYFGREIHKKSADIVIYKEDKETPYILFEIKKPKIEEGLDQLKSYIESKGSPIGVWSNGLEKVILYRQYPKEYEKGLRDIPRVDQTPEDVLEERLTLEQLTGDYDLTERIKILEELVLANAGVDVFNEIFKLIYAKLYDETEAKTRTDHEVYFRRSKDPKITYDTINRLFKESAERWPGIFQRQENIELLPDHLDTCLLKLEDIKLLDSNLEIIDAAFEYLLPEVAKGKKGQYFTPRHVIDMAVKMLNPREDEYIVDPAAGSGGFLIHTMQWVWNHDLKNTPHQKKIEYAQRYLFGIDFDDKPVKISRALMLIAGDGRSHIFKLNSLNPKEWQGSDAEKEKARAELRPLLLKTGDYTKDRENEENFKYFTFDILLTNPPFAGEIRETSLLRNYELAMRKGKVPQKAERDLLFIERALQLIKPGGRMAIVLPQGKLNNTNTEYVRQWLMDKARILAVVGLNVNTFKPHTGTKTSVLFLQKWNEGEKLPEDYPIFMAVSKKSGKDNSGDYVYKKDEKGDFILDEKGRRILDHDLDEIAEAFVKFAKEQKFSFWE
ncbi:MAG TPA: N-6 DNA methylase [Candidatus Paceibacterota bacterium]|mgnify:FL=1|nr:N-6 DNA methylase [Candidatus Paceibacterota bacterium]